MNGQSQPWVKRMRLTAPFWAYTIDTIERRAAPVSRNEMSTPCHTGAGSWAGGGSAQATSSPSSDSASSYTFGASTNSRVSGLLFS